MTPANENKRGFLFLQGPHGPFYAELSQHLEDLGHKTWRVAFNQGDVAFWKNKRTLIRHTEPLTEWANYFRELVKSKKITDIVLYGDTGEIHATAVLHAKRLNLTVHVFEEGYLRPYWVTYERNGSNGNSRLMDMSVTQLREMTKRLKEKHVLPPAHWGDTRHHVFYGALYHWFVMFANLRFPNFTPHRKTTAAQEFKWHLRRLYRRPFHSLLRWRASRRVSRLSVPYHLVMLQLEHDASVQYHSPFNTTQEFLEVVFQAFANGAPSQHHLVFKSHPLDDGRVNLRKIVTELAAHHGVEDRVHFIYGGKLAKLLDHAKTAVTINSTAGQQALWRSIPLKTFGSSIYGKPEFVSDAPLSEFFADPDQPDSEAYILFREFLLCTSQLPGGFYSPSGRRQLLRSLTESMLAKNDPYDNFMKTPKPRGTILRLVG